MKINGSKYGEGEIGCYVAGHHGQYAMGVMLWTAAGIHDDIVRHGDDETCDVCGPWRDIANRELAAYPPASEQAQNARPDLEEKVAAADNAEMWLNDHATQDGYLWHWRDGEFFLSPTCEDGECGRDDCACWEWE